MMVRGKTRSKKIAPTTNTNNNNKSGTIDIFKKHYNPNDNVYGQIRETSINSGLDFSEQLIKTNEEQIKDYEEKIINERQELLKDNISEETKKQINETIKKFEKEIKHNNFKISAEQNRIEFYNKIKSEKLKPTIEQYENIKKEGNPFIIANLYKKYFNKELIGPTISVNIDDDN